MRGYRTRAEIENDKAWLKDVLEHTNNWDMKNFCWSRLWLMKREDEKN